MHTDTNDNECNDITASFFYSTRPCRFNLFFDLNDEIIVKWYQLTQVKSCRQVQQVLIGSTSYLLWGKRTKFVSRSRRKNQKPEGEYRHPSCGRPFGLQAIHKRNNRTFEYGRQKYAYRSLEKESTLLGWWRSRLPLSLFSFFVITKRASVGI